MLDFLVAVAQFICFLGLLYGAITCLAHRDCVDDLRAHYDPITAHDWLPLREATPQLRSDSRAADLHADERRLAA